MHEWREKRRAEIHYDGSQYGRRELAWAQRSFIQPQVMVEERYLYDPVAGKYTVDRYLDDLEARYGGIDSVLIWPVYPNIGIDNRNQHDLLHDMPGGLPGLRQMVADFHRRNVRVLFPVMPWDVGTRPEGVPLWAAAARDMKAVAADGINGDTMGGIGREFRKASDDCGHPLVLEPEGHFGDDGMLAWNNMSWGYWQYQPVPVVSKYKWLEPRHMVNVCERWAKDRSDGLQSAFFNGVGYESWENVWGIWNQLTPRDAEAMRRIRPSSGPWPRLLTSAEWQPHFPTMQAAAGVYASRFPGTRPNAVAAGQPQRQRFDGPATQGCRDCNGDAISTTCGMAIELPAGGRATRPRSASRSSNAAMGRSWPSRATRCRRRSVRLLPRMRATGENPLGGPVGPMEVPAAEDRRYSADRTGQGAPEGMVLVRGGKYRFKVSGVEIEGGDGPGVDFQYPWEDLPRRHHDKEMDIQGFYIDKYPVTNAQFKRFLDASGYKPKDEHNFLKDWQGGTYPAGLGPQAGHLGLAGGRPGLCRLGRQAAAARMGMAVRGAGQRRPALSLGQGPRSGRVAQARSRSRTASADRRRRVSQGRQPVGRDGPRGQRLAVDRRVCGRAHPRGGCSRRQLLPAQRLEMVLPGEYAVGPARQVPAHRPVERPLGDGRLPLRGGCGGSLIAGLFALGGREWNPLLQIGPAPTAGLGPVQ